MKTQVHKYEFRDDLDLLIEVACKLKAEGALFRAERSPEGPGWRLLVLELESVQRCEHAWETLPDGTVMCFECDQKFKED